MGDISQKKARKLGDEFTRIGQQAVEEARKENHRLGLPNIMERNGEVIYELPDGTITIKKPDILERHDKA